VEWDEDQRRLFQNNVTDTPEGKKIVHAQSIREWQVMTSEQKRFVDLENDHLIKKESQRRPQLTK